MNKNKFIRAFLIFAAICINIKYIFVDFGIDAEFQISMSYRLASGDILFKEMWEAYQMSTFLCAFFIKIYTFLFGTTTGIVIYLQTIGVLIDGAIAYLLYKVVNKYFDCENIAFAMAWVFFLVSPKDVPLPEYTNMQVWFSMLLCICLFLQHQTGKKIWVFLGALSLCLAVLSYPSCLLLALGAAVLFWYKRELQNLFLFLGTCAAAGISYLLFIFSRISVKDFGTVIQNIMNLEVTHQISFAEKYGAYLRDIVKLAAVFAVVYLISYGIARLISQEKATDLLFLGGIALISFYTILFYQSNVRYNYAIVFLAIILVGMRHARKLSEEQFYFYLCGTILSVLNLIATLLLTDLAFIASVPLLLIGVVSAFLPISERMKEIDGRALLALGVLLLLFRGVYIIRPMWLQMNPIWEVGGIVKAGPAKGIISTYMGPYMQNESVKEWKQYIQAGDKIYLIGDPLDTLGYLYLDTEVAAPSVVPTPGYNESILKYWEMNPDKYPDVIIASCWYGELNAALSENEWMKQWIEKEYQPKRVIDGKYWRYYFKDAE